MPSNPLQLQPFVITNQGNDVYVTGPFSFNTSLPTFVDVRPGSDGCFNRAAAHVASCCVFEVALGAPDV